ncbi:tryptophan synthase subunit beta [bacterium]|nr:tryptophan synthase subunit beta [bacterium]
MINYQADDRGFFGKFGGAYVPEILRAAVDQVLQGYQNITNQENFKAELQILFRDYIGRPSPLYFASRLSKHLGARVFLKREELNHTGSHKINNAIGQTLLAKYMGKKRIIAETGAGQHGVATATAAALLNFPCEVYMGELDVARQAPNVERMLMLGAKVHPVASGSRTLKDATNQAIRAWINDPDETYYVIGSVVGPHPYPALVAKFQSVISEEIKQQLKEKTGTELPDVVIACVGGGSNAIGAFYHFLDQRSVELIGVEAAGRGLSTGESAATLALGSEGVLHGSRTIVMHNQDGQILETHSISAGLDYPGIGPQHAHLHDTARATYVSATDDEALAAAFELSKLEGILPALEPAHALAYLLRTKWERKSDGSEKTIVLNLCGRGDKDLETYRKYQHARN